MDLSRKKGFKFDNLTVDNTNDIYLVDVDTTQSSNLRYNNFIAPNRNGAIYKTYGYDDKQITLTIALWGQNIAARRTKQRSLLQQITGKQGKLTFLDEPTLFYIARQYDAIKIKEDECMTSFEISFICSYCLYEFYDDLRDYPVSQLTMKADSIGALVCSAAWEDITETTAKTINNGGNYETKPIIKLDGTGTLVTITLNGRAFSISNLNGIIFVNCEDMTVYKMSDGKKVSCLQQFSGLFPILSAGNNNCVIGGTSINIDVTVDFKNTYIV